MNNSRRKLVIGIGGSSGAVYAKQLMDSLARIPGQWEKVAVVASPNALENWRLEIGDWDPSTYPFDFYEKMDFNAPFASGSARFDTMIICPCSMGLLARVATGISTDLMTRAADVVLKERRRLILVPREAPYNLIHLQNMTRLTEAGAIICPASPSFYSGANTLEQLVQTVVDRILDLAGFEPDTFRWGEIG
jgi:4-hydroxy-3-polyprenylbenzoate decarboxylase